MPPPRALLRAADSPTERARRPRTLPRGPFPLLPHGGLQPLNCYIVNRLLPPVPAEDWGLFCILSCRILNVQDPAGSQASGSIQAQPLWPALSLRGLPVPQPRTSPAPCLPGHAEGPHRKAPSPTGPLCQHVVRTSSRLTPTVTPQPGRGRWRRPEAAEAPAFLLH